MGEFLKVLAVGATFALTAGSASAVTVKLGDPGDVTSGIGEATGTFAAAGVTGTIIADAGPFGDPAITQDPVEGLGVLAEFKDNADSIESVGLAESLTILFDQVVALVSITAGFVDMNDAWNITVFGTGGDQSFAASALSTGPAPYALEFVDPILATGFVISASGGTCVERVSGLCMDFDANDVSLQSFEVTTAPTPAPVPLPAAGWLLLAGLGGIAAVARRKAA